MADALIALHFQNDTCHADGRMPFSLDRDAPQARTFLAASAAALAAARARGWTVVHIHIAFADDYADMPRHARLFRKAAEFGAVKRGSWGAAPFAGFAPRPGEIALAHSCNSGFRNTDLDRLLRERDVESLHVMGMATQFSVEHTVRDAADLGYRVVVLSDCCMTADSEAARCSLRTMAMLADIATSDSLPS